MSRLLFFTKMTAILLFIANTGIFSGMTRMIISEEQYQSDPVLMLQINDLSERQWEKANAKVASGEIYSPRDYFKDLGQIYRLEDSLGMTRGIGGVWGSRIIRLQALSLESVRNKHFTWSDVDVVSKEFNENIGGFFRDDARNDLKNASWSDAWETLLNWLVIQYKRGIPLAFIFLLIWIYDEDRKKERFKLNNPVSFLMCLILYPVVLGITLRRWLKISARGFYAEVELRRTKDKFLSMISENEVMAIREFAESCLSLRTWKLKLIGEGFILKRSFASAAVATFICLFLYGHNCFAKAVPDDNQSHPKICCLEYEIDRSGPLEIGKEISYGTDFERSCIFEWIIPATIFKKLENVIRKIAGTVRKIEHVPISGLIARFFITTYLSTKKEIKNEIRRLCVYDGFYGLCPVVCRRP